MKGGTALRRPFEDVVFVGQKEENDALYDWRDRLVESQHCLTSC